jgi:hypothetical protein
MSAAPDAAKRPYISNDLSEGVPSSLELKDARGAETILLFRMLFFSSIGSKIM